MTPQTVKKGTKVMVRNDETKRKHGPCEGKHPHIWANAEASELLTFLAMVSSEKQPLEKRPCKLGLYRTYNVP